MTAQLDWFIKGKVVEGRIIGELGGSETGKLSRDLIHYFVQTNSSKVHVLFDISKMQTSPINMTLLSTILLPLFIDPICGWVFVYGTDRTIDDLFEVSSRRIFRRRLVSCQTRAQALEMLNQKVPYLKQLQTA